MREPKAPRAIVPAVERSPGDRDKAKIYQILGATSGKRRETSLVGFE